MSEKKVMKNDSSGENIADGLAFGGHVFDVDDFGGNKAGGATSNK